MWPKRRRTFANPCVVAEDPLATMQWHHPVLSKCARHQHPGRRLQNHPLLGWKLGDILCVSLSSEEPSPLTATDPYTQLFSDRIDRLSQAHPSAAFRLEAEGVKRGPCVGCSAKAPLANTMSALDHLEHCPCAIAGQLAGCSLLRRREWIWPLEGKANRVPVRHVGMRSWWS